jgi:hypothetical protein
MNCDSNAYNHIPHKLLQDCVRRPKKKKENKQNKALQKFPFYAKLEVTIV